MRRQINHKTMRVIVGLIALLLSPVVFVLSGYGNELSSISISYWTDSRDIFVGSLIAVGFFLFAYNGAGDKRDLEFCLSKLACFFAIGIALFPTDGFNDHDIPSQWVLAIADTFATTPAWIHGTSAVLLFLCLIAMMWFFSVRAMSKGKPSRAYFYRAVSVLMILGIVSLFFIGDMKAAVFWLEVWELTLFGVGWLVAGSYRTV